MRPYRILVSTLFTIAVTANAVEEHHPQLEPIVQDYIFWTDLAVHSQPAFEKKAGKSGGEGLVERELARILQPDCRIVEHGGTEQVSYNVSEFANSLGRARFMSDATGPIIEGPTYVAGTTETHVQVTQFLSDVNEDTVLETSLVFPATAGAPRASAIFRKFRDPTEADFAKVREKRRPVAYNPKLGLGARYLGGGCFYGGPPCFSPDGSQIVFVRVHNENCDLFSINTDGTQERQITSSPTWEICPKFSPDGSSILFLSDSENRLGEPCEVAVKERGPARIGLRMKRLWPTLENCSLPEYSADHEVTALAVGKRDSLRLAISRFDRIEIPDLQGVSLRGQPLLTADGNSAFFVGTLPRKPVEGLVFELFSIQLDGSAPKRLTTSQTMKALYGITSAPARLIFTAQDDKYRDHLWMCEPDGSDAREILSGHPRGVCQVRVSPNGQYIGFTSDRDKKFRFDLYIMGAGEAGHERQLTSGPEGIDEYAFSPDSKQIALVITEKDAPRCGLGTIGILPTAGGQIRKVTKNY